MPLERESPVPVKTQHQWTCPMHPEVLQDKPGACPVCGMDLELNGPDPVPDAGDTALRSLSFRFWLALIFTLPVLLIAMGKMLPGLRADSWLHAEWTRWTEALGCTVVLFAGSLFFRRGRESLKNRSLNMFTLISVGVGAAYLFSLVALLAPGLFPDSFRTHGKVGLYFEAASVIITLVLLGQVLEARARSYTGHAVQALLELGAKSAHRIRNEKEEEVPIEEVQPGDLLRVRPGEKVPLDGTLLKGESYVDESMITGESEPIQKGPGESLIGATVNLSGSFVMRAERVGSETLLARIVEQVARAQRSRAPVQNLVDRIAAWFVPAVFAVAVLTFLIWAAVGPAPALAFALSNAVAVLIIACPCALGLATPMSIMVGVGSAARAGILIRNAEAIQSAEKVTHLITDKTGTLTAGRPAVTELIPESGVTEVELITWAAALEFHSEHPIARAIVAAARERAAPLPEVSGFQATVAGGVSGAINGVMVQVGKASFLVDHGVRCSAALLERGEGLQRQARTVVWVAHAGKMAGLVAIADPIKKTTPAAIRRLQDAGIRVIMCTGDNAETARSVADELGIEEVHAEVLPEDKQHLIETLKREGAVVAMAGDGINDAPALAAADVGIAMGTGTDVAIESAPITLVKGDLSGVSKALDLSHAVMRNIRQNLFFAFAYNALGIPIAAGILYPVSGILLSPMIAGAAMAFSSLSVIANALRLRARRVE